MATEAPAPTLASSAGRAMTEVNEQMARARKLELELRDAMIALQSRIDAGEKVDLKELFPALGAAFQAQRPDVMKVMSTVMGPILAEVSTNSERHKELVHYIANLGRMLEEKEKRDATRAGNKYRPLYEGL